MRILKKHIQKLNSILDSGLIRGSGSKAKPGNICVEQAVCIALGYKFSDNPPCVSRAFRSLKMRLNDCSGWSSNKARAEGLRKLAVVQIGSRGALDDQEFTRRVTEATIQQIIPRALRNAAKVCPRYAERLEAAAVRCMQEGTRKAALAAKEIAGRAATTANVAATTAANASYAATAAANAAATTADAARYAVNAANAAADCAADCAHAANAAAAADAAASAAHAADAAATTAVAARYAAHAADAAANKATARDAEMIFFADMVLAILVDMAVPGVKYLKWIK